jgi:hypothetical protein
MIDRVAVRVEYRNVSDRTLQKMAVPTVSSAIVTQSDLQCNPMPLKSKGGLAAISPPISTHRPGKLLLCRMVAIGKSIANDNIGSAHAPGLWSFCNELLNSAAALCSVSYVFSGLITDAAVPLDGGLHCRSVIGSRWRRREVGKHTLVLSPTDSTDRESIRRKTHIQKEFPGR